MSKLCVASLRLHLICWYVCICLHLPVHKCKLVLQGSTIGFVRCEEVSGQWGPYVSPRGNSWLLAMLTAQNMHVAQPLQNNLAELRNLMDFCCEGLLGSARTFARFVRPTATRASPSWLTSRPGQSGTLEVTGH